VKWICIIILCVFLFHVFHCLKNRLQQQFNEYVFDREQSIYRSEGLDWTSISYKDNQHVIDLISKKPNGLLVMLEEQGMLNR
jgi:myosin-5